MHAMLGICFSLVFVNLDTIRLFREISAHFVGVLDINQVTPNSPLGGYRQSDIDTNCINRTNQDMGERKNKKWGGCGDFVCGEMIRSCSGIRINRNFNLICSLTIRV